MSQHAILVHRQTSGGPGSITRRLTLAPVRLCPATTTSRDHSEASLDGVWLVEQLVVLPKFSLVTGGKAFLTPLMNRFHFALWCSWSLERVGLLLGASEGAF